DYIDVLHVLNQARLSKDVSVAVARARDAAEALYQAFQTAKLVPPKNATTYEALYGASALVGRIAIVFAEGTDGTAAATAAAAGSALSSIAVGGRILVNLCDEHTQLTTSAFEASKRNQMRQELLVKLSQLRDEKERLTWAVGRATP